MPRPGQLQGRRVAPDLGLEALRERRVAPESDVAASGTGTLQERCVAPEAALQERCVAPEVTLQRPGALQERSVTPEAALAAFGSVAGALHGPRSSSCSAWERCRSVAVAWKQQLQRPEALQERCRGQEAAVPASRSVAEARRR